MKVPLLLLNSRRNCFSMTCNKGQPEEALKWRNDCLATYTRNTATVGGQLEGGEGPLFPSSFYFKMILFEVRACRSTSKPNLCIVIFSFESRSVILFTFFLIDKNRKLHMYKHIDVICLLYNIRGLETGCVKVECFFLFVFFFIFSLSMHFVYIRWCCKKW